MQILASSPLLTLFLVIALGTLFGSIPFGPLKFGAAGALFVGLAAGALDPKLGEISPWSRLSDLPYSSTPSVWPRAPPSSATCVSKPRF